MQRRARKLAALLATQLVLMLRGSAALSGSVSCPCVDAQNTSNFPAIVAALNGLGNLPDPYGTAGCRKYESNSVNPGFDSSCTGAADQDQHCESAWCYVDPVKCGINRDACHGAGLLLNNPVNETCRSRKYDPSTVLPWLYYSYETCGYLNSYDTSRVFPGLGNSDLIVATTTYRPYHIVQPHPDPERDDVTFTGPYLEFFKTAMSFVNPPPNIVWDTSFATAQSRELFSSSYTACVHDVAVGHYDMCVADTWILPERVLLTSFTPPIRYDYFYMVVLDSGAAKPSFMEMMEKPLLPFSWGSWGLTLGVTMIAAVVNSICDGDNENDYPYAPHDFVLRSMKSVYLAISSFLNGVPVTSDETVPAKIAAIGYNWFILVMLASYTANLASILVIPSPYSGITTVEEAIALNYKICSYSTAIPSLQQTFPDGVFVETDESTWARFMWSGVCDVSIIYDERIDTAWAGELKKNDCAAEAAGDLTAEEAQCTDERDDCKILKVSDNIMAFGSGFPVRKELMAGISWGMSIAESAGEWQLQRDRFSSEFKTGNCDAGGDDETASLPIDAFAGTVIQSAIIMGIAILLAAYEKFSGKRIESLVQRKPPASKTSQEDSSKTTDDFAAADMVLNHGGKPDDSPNLGLQASAMRSEMESQNGIPQEDTQTLIKSLKFAKKNQRAILEKLDQLLGESGNGSDRMDPEAKRRVPLKSSDESQTSNSAAPNNDNWFTSLLPPIMQVGGGNR